VRSAVAWLGGATAVNGHLRHLGNFAFGLTGRCSCWCLRGKVLGGECGQCTLWPVKRLNSYISLIVILVN
jgi:hypothetical protein